MKNLRTDILEAFLSPYDEVLEHEEFPIIVPDDYFDENLEIGEKYKGDLYGYDFNGNSVQIANIYTLDKLKSLALYLDNETGSVYQENTLTIHLNQYDGKGISIYRNSPIVAGELKGTLFYRKMYYKKRLIDVSNIENIREESKTMFGDMFKHKQNGINQEIIYSMCERIIKISKVFGLEEKKFSIKMDFDYDIRRIYLYYSAPKMTYIDAIEGDKFTKIGNLRSSLGLNGESLEKYRNPTEEELNKIIINNR